MRGGGKDGKDCERGVWDFCGRYQSDSVQIRTTKIILKKKWETLVILMESTMQSLDFDMVKDYEDLMEKWLKKKKK